jgi:hypothetical protein
MNSKGKMTNDMNKPIKNMLNLGLTPSESSDNYSHTRRESNILSGPMERLVVSLNHQNEESKGSDDDSIGKLFINSVET